MRWSRVAHANGGLDAVQARGLDDDVARLYGLTAPDLEQVRAFDARLSRHGDGG